MKNRGASLRVLLTMIALVVAAVSVRTPARAEGAAGFVLSSDDIGSGKPLARELVSNARGCTGGNQSPALAWTGAPSGTKSFAIVLFDPDAAQGRGLLHWLVVNIPAEISSVDRDVGKADGSKLPAGAAHFSNGYRETGYSGPCPPAADAPHSYLMTLYALSTDKIVLPPDVSAVTMLSTIEGSAIAKSSISFMYGRKTQ